MKELGLVDMDINLENIYISIIFLLIAVFLLSASFLLISAGISLLGVN